MPVRGVFPHPDPSHRPKLHPPVLPPVPLTQASQQLLVLQFFAYLVVLKVALSVPLTHEAAAAKSGASENPQRGAAHTTAIEPPATAACIADRREIRLALVESVAFSSGT